MKEKRAAQLQDKYLVRFPGDLRDRLKEAAIANGRSMNAEIIARLETPTVIQPLPPPGQKTVMLESVVKDLTAEIAELRIAIAGINKRAAW